MGVLMPHMPKFFNLGLKLPFLIINLNLVHPCMAFYITSLSKFLLQVRFLSNLGTSFSVRSILNNPEKLFLWECPIQKKFRITYQFNYLL